MASGERECPPGRWRSRGPGDPLPPGGPISKMLRGASGKRHLLMAAESLSSSSRLCCWEGPSHSGPLAVRISLPPPLTPAPPQPSSTSVSQTPGRAGSHVTGWGKWTMNRGDTRAFQAVQSHMPHLSLASSSLADLLG